jgi:hypothetical protein
MKLLINGSRGFDDYKLMELVVSELPPTEVGGFQALSSPDSV